MSYAISLSYRDVRFFICVINDAINYQNDIVLVTHDLNDEKIKLLRQKPFPVTSCPQ